MTPPEMATEIAARSLAAAQSLGLRSAHYPAPGNLPALPTLVVSWMSFETTQGMGEQYRTDRFRGRIFTANADSSGNPIAVEGQISEVDDLVLPIVDAFDATAHRANFTIDNQVDGCTCDTGELNKGIPYAGQTYYGGELFWTVQSRHFA